MVVSEGSTSGSLSVVSLSDRGRLRLRVAGLKRVMLKHHQKWGEGGLLFRLGGAGVTVVVLQLEIPAGESRSCYIPLDTTLIAVSIRCLAASGCNLGAPALRDCRCRSW
eukprot:TRINITY_DN3259_c0_g1_i1.p2 TRINITY_DN3259_c0_g1~~TRINITY_DN3259_c0_g1_i1.p2  ORF type:complete len:109 (-),score=3.09 TRINITY_DN3259_c0_g1_i1:74-400(-)